MKALFVTSHTLYLQYYFYKFISESAKTTYAEDDKDSDVNEISDLRRRTAPLLEDIDPTYSGKKVSRQALGHIFQKGKVYIILSFFVLYKT